MFFKLGILVFFTIFNKIEARCKCDQLTTHYDKFGCKPIYEKDDDCCPIRYDCDEVFKKISNNTECHFGGKVYKLREQLDFELTQSSCRAACFCSKRDDEEFTCAHIDCPEFLGAFPLKPACFRQYDLDSCCSKNITCPPFDNVAKCIVGNNTYYEGQRFENPENQCDQCICLKGFEGKFVQPFCKPYPCNVEFKTVEFRKNCAPHYTEYDKCCPYFWKCQTVEDAELTKNKTAILKSDMPNACTFGNRILKIGETLMFDLTNCTCKIPPLATCE